MVNKDHLELSLYLNKFGIRFLRLKLKYHVSNYHVFAYKYLNKKIYWSWHKFYVRR